MLHDALAMLCQDARDVVDEQLADDRDAGKKIQPLDAGNAEVIDRNDIAKSVQDAKEAAC